MKIVSTAEYSARELTDLFNLGFEDYFVPIDINEAVFAFLCAVSLVDFSRSLVAEVNGEPAGFLLLGNRGWTLRGAAMGITKDHRGIGVGTALMERAIEDCQKAGFHSMILEVFEDNQPAIAVYEKCGFTKKRRLVGYERPAREPPEANDTLKEIDPYEVAIQVAQEAEPNLPWMCSPEFFAAFPPDLSKGYALENKAFAIIMSRANDLMRLSAVIIPRKYRRQGWGRRLLNGLFTLYPDKAWEIIPVVPEDLAPGFFANCGFQLAELNQLEMARAVI